MNIKKELKKYENREKLRNTVKKGFLILKNLLCQHKDCISEIVDVELGNCENSILEELLGEDAKKVQQMRMRITRCANCGRELYRAYIDIDDPEL